MKKQFLIISAILLCSLVACSSNNPSGNPDGDLLTLYDENAKLVVGGYGKDASDDDEWFPLATYRHKNNGEAPYIDVSQFLDFLNITFHNSINYENMSSTRLESYDSIIKKVSNHVYGIYSEEVLGATLDTEENVITINRFDYTFAQTDSFNGILRNDIAAPNNSVTSLVHGTYRSTYHGNFKNEVYDLDDYNMDIVELNNKVYVPAQLFSNLIMRSMGADIVYNGNDFFISSTVTGATAMPNLVGSFRSSNNTFEISGTLYNNVTPVGENEAYRFVGRIVNPETQEVKYGIFSLDKDGSGYAFSDPNQNATSSENPGKKLLWEIVNNDLYITICDKGPTGEFNTTGHVMRVSSNETFYNKKSRSTALSEFNYQLLRFQIDNLYGLKPELNAKHGFVDFESFVTEKGLKEKLLSTDTRTYDEGLTQLLMGYIDDGHTKYLDRSIFTGMEDVSVDDLVDRYIGPRRKTLLDKHDEYVAYRQSVVGDGVEPLGVFFEGETAVIRFDAFSHLLPIISDPGTSMDMLDLPTLMQASTPFGFLRSFKEIATHEEIKNVVLDLTCNGGGMVLTLPFLAACFTKDPTIYLKDNLSGVVREFHYDVDLNLDGVHHGEGDYLGDKYHFYLLTSDFSFSCASAFPTMAKIAGVDIIGVKCAGGACNVAGFTDACGSIYTLSAPQQIGYLDENGEFVNDDAGIAVTHELDKESWYDLTKLNTAIQGFNAN